MPAAGSASSTALALHGAGLTVVAIDRNEAGLTQLPDEVHREVADATDPAVPGPLVDRIAAQIGPPDILVNTIGAFELGDALTVTAQNLEQLMGVNLGAALWLTQAVVPYMQQKGSGVIVHIAARPGVEPTAGFAAYGRVQSRTGAPGPYPRRRAASSWHPGQRRRPPDHRHRKEQGALPPPEALANAVEPGAIAEVIAFLVSDKAESVSGAVVPTYGG